MKIDTYNIKKITTTASSRSIQSKNNIHIKSNMYPFSKEYLGYLETLNSHEVASIILDKQNWIKSRTNKPKKTWRYTPGDIVLTYLGSSNYGYEASYFHPAIVLKNEFNWILVIPCSSTRYGKKDNYTIDAKISDGFSKNTGISLDKIRIIDKSRVLRNASGGTVGKVNPTLMKKINENIFNLYLDPIKNDFEKLQKNYSDLKEEFKKLQKNYSDLKEEFDKSKKIS